MKFETKVNILIISFLIFLLAMFVIDYRLTKLEFKVNGKPLFSCNPYYDGTMYPEPKCQNFFINRTGNYCNGKLVCQNS